MKVQIKEILQIKMGNQFFKKPNYEEAPFNMAMLYYFGLDQLINKKCSAMINKDLETAFECFEELFTKIYFKLNKKEYEDLKEKFDNLRTKIKFVKLKDMQNIGNELIINDMREIDRKIMKLLDKYKMIFPGMNSAVGIDKIRQRYDL